MGGVRERVFRVDGPLDLWATLAPLRRGGGDPTCRVDPAGFWRATRTPSGPASTLVRALSTAGEVQIMAWGPGADWAVEHGPSLVGADDDASTFDPGRHPLVAELWRRHQGARFCRSGAVTEALVPTILEQKVVALDAKQSYRRLVRAFGERAPGPFGAAGGMLPPAAARLAGLPSWAFHRFNVERRRADAVRVACRVAHRLDECRALPVATARHRLRALPGVGVWSTAEATRVALGDADAVSFGDYHLKHLVSYSLVGEPVGTDERMAELLEPWADAGQRGRVVRLLELGGSLPPRRGPRMPRQSIAAI
jgi:hypothetical protein